MRQLSQRNAKLLETYFKGNYVACPTQRKVKLKFVYSEKATKFAKSPPYFCLQYIKFRYSEKATKIWPFFHFFFDIT